MKLFLWNYNMRKNATPGFSIVFMRGVAIIYFELRVSCKNFNYETLYDYFFISQLCFI